MLAEFERKRIEAPLKNKIAFLENEIKMQKKIIEDKDLYLAQLEEANKELQEEVEEFSINFEN